MKFELAIDMVWKYPKRRGIVGRGVALIAVTALLVAACSSDKAGDDSSAGASSTTTTKATTSSADEARPMAEFSGKADDTTETFRVAANWEIRWRVAAGKHLAVELLTKDGTSRGQVIDAGDKAEGSTFVSEEGEFKLKVTADGEWSLQAIGRLPTK